MEFKDYYKILGVSEDSDTTTIKSAYRKLARKYHPDLNKGSDVEAKFKDVAEAYEVLKNKEKRAEYDELKNYGQAGQSFQPPPGWQSASRHGHSAHEQYGGDFSDFFESIFANAGASGQGGFRQKGQDIETDLPLFLEDTLEQTKKAIVLDIPFVNEQGQRQSRKKTLNVKIPKGTLEGERIRLKGQGGAGVGGGENGDLYLRIKLAPHPVFDVHGHDLDVVVPLLPWEAVLGDKITVPTLDGKVQLTISADSQSGQRLRIKGKGLYHQGSRGDLYAVLKVVMPKQTSADDKKLWQSLADNSTDNPRLAWEL